jgi:hypothetical protein
LITTHLDHGEEHFMPYFHSTGPPATSLSEWLGRLRRTFDNLATQLHGGIARAIADAIGCAVEQGLRKVLSGGAVQPSVRPTWPHDTQHWSPSRSRAAAWSEDESSSWLDDEDGNEDVEWRQSVATHGRPASAPPAQGPTSPSRWLPALAAGVRSALWWLSRHAPCRPMMTSLAIGLTVAVTWLAIPAKWAVGLGAITLADAARAGTAELASYLTS